MGQPADMLRQPQRTDVFTRAPRGAVRRAPVTAAAVTREIAVVAVLFVLYKLGRSLTADHLTRALGNAKEVVHLERRLGWFSEVHLQRAFLRFPELVEMLNRYYLFVHFPVTVAFLVWAFVRHRSGYRPVRNVLAAVTFAGLLIHIVYPLAPPRMLTTHGFIDTGLVFGPGAYGRGGFFDSAANQIAAMPSLHFAWSIVVAWGVITLASPVWHGLALTHSWLTLVAIVVTANHYWLDALVALVLVLIAVATVGRAMVHVAAARTLERPMLRPVRVAARARRPVA